MDLLAALPADRRRAFVLTQLLGLSYEEAARRAGCPSARSAPEWPVPAPP